jgi:hypothetical protein
MTSRKTVPPDVLFVNGASSAGKTSLIRAVQDLIPVPYLHVGLDHFFSSVPEPWGGGGPGRYSGAGFAYQACEGSDDGLPRTAITSESGFATKAAALTGGRDQEASIRAGRFTDPDTGKTTVGEWIDRWLALQDVGISTQDSREYMIRRFIRPTWGDRPLNSLTTENITKWERTLPATTGVQPRTARAARTLLGTILGDAVANRPPLLAYNPALRPRNRGRRTGRRLEQAPQRAWATPQQTLLLAERAALLSGRDEDFTLIITIGYTGLRWGEAIGLERDLARPTEIYVEWQLRELNGKFHRIPSKDDSYRSPRWEPGLPVDLPPFLAGLLNRQLREHPHGLPMRRRARWQRPVRVPRP